MEGHYFLVIGSQAISLGAPFCHAALPRLCLDMTLYPSAKHRKSPVLQIFRLNTHMSDSTRVLANQKAFKGWQQHLKRKHQGKCSRFLSSLSAKLPLSKFHDSSRTCRIRTKARVIEHRFRQSLYDTASTEDFGFAPTATTIMPCSAVPPKYPLSAFKH